ncbi:MAG TPA: MMPL family transporter [Solirubrobacterales bacterium]|nr:MMPL family transporter [Solirubrobacterales bacterium]
MAPGEKRGTAIGRLAAAVTGRRGRWIAIAIWLLLAAAGLLARDHIGEVTAAGQTSFLPANSESTKALEALRLGSQGGEEVPVVIVFERKGGLTRADLDAIGRTGAGLNQLGITGATPVIAPFDGEDRGELRRIARIADGIGPISRDGEAALVVLALNAADRGAVVNGVTKIRHYLGEHRRPGLAAYVTGPGGIAADLEQVADEAGRILLFATLGLVLILLLAVYRAPILALLPLLVVGAAYLIATGIAYLLIEAGWITVNAEGTMLLLVLIFGAGTDYSLLLVHRYREELGNGRAPAAALPAALAETAPAIAASGGTVIAAMLVLLVAELESTHWLGPILAIGIATMLVAAFTLLPALLAALGDRAFWPARPARGSFSSPGVQKEPRNSTPSSRGSFRTHGVQKEPRDVWERVAGLVRRRSRGIIGAVLVLLAVLALGNFTDHGTLGFGQGETRATNSSRGTEALEAHFPPGIGSPLTAVVEVEEAEWVARGMSALEQVNQALPVPADEQAIVLLILDGSPYSSEAAEEVAEIRERLHELAPGALLGGIPAENYDIEQTNARDTKLIVPLILLVVGLILAAVLRAVVAPVYLIATVVASFAATLGLATFAFTEVFGAAGLAFNLTLMAFLFLVALGVDYNIFLMARAREEAVALGTREGVLSALVNTGGVVTGAGLILAGTFATLVLLPLEELVQIGATVAVGVLLDTFVVRALLIPAITYRLGDRAWWPSQ